MMEYNAVMTSAMDFKSLVAACADAFNRNDPDELRAALDAVELQLPVGPQMSTADLAGLAGLLIDGGALLRRVSAVEMGLRVFEDNWDRLESVYGASQLHYNIGNGYKSLYDIRRADPNWKFNLESAKPGLMAKSRYWRSVRAARRGKATPEQLTNLGNALNACGRVVDALHYYDRALGMYPDFGMAHVNRGLALLYLNRVSGGYSVKLLHEVYRSFDAARRSDTIEPQAIAGANEHAESITKIIREHGHEPTEDPDSVRQDAEEERQHDPYWRWCLECSLALSEHSLYCRCAGARRDDLSIMSPTSRLSGEKVPAMELLLNRVKSEYCLARALLFQSAPQDVSLKWNVSPFEGTFTELFDDEEVGVEVEFLRTSFRLCFGILDRIARGICEFLGVAKMGDKLYFDSFWHPPGQDGSARWDALNAREDSSLVALYGLASDLNERSGGEWSHLKRYRNLFEHELCVVRRDFGSLVVPPWFADSEVPSVPLKETASDVADMLRFTRGAIFYFTFLIRQASRDPGGGEGPTITFGKKPIGKE